MGCCGYNKLTKAQMIKSVSETLIAVAKKALSGGGIYAPSALQQGRMKVCFSCPNMNKELMRCKQCGCFLRKKVVLVVSSCPLGLW